MKYQVFVSGAPKCRAEFDYTETEAYATRAHHDGDKHHDGESRRRGWRTYDTGERQRPSGQSTFSGGDGAAYAAHGGTPALRRFPPAIQFLTDVDPYVQHQLQTLCVRSHRQGKNLQDVCQELYLYGRSIGYALTLGVQEVFSHQMPSFPQQTVQSALLMVDVKRITAPNGYHEGRVAV